MESVQGHLLIASSRVPDPRFIRVVILVLRHSQDGATGVVLNRPLSVPLQDVREQLNNKPISANLRVQYGGPVSSPVLAIHKAKSVAEFETHPGVFLAVEARHVDWLLKQKRFPFRLFVGHADWAAGQLENELSNGHWLVVPATDDLIFNEGDDLWSRVVRKIERQERAVCARFAQKY